MLIDYNALVALLERSGLPDQGAPPSIGVTIRFKEIKPVEGSQQFTTPDGRFVGLALNAAGELCAIGLTACTDSGHARILMNSRRANPTHFRLDHVQLAMPAGEEKAARAFYVGALGFEEVAKPAELAQRGGAWFRSGSANVHLGVDPNFVPSKKAHPALQCANYDALLERVAAHGVAVIPDTIPFDGKRHAYIADPFGNRIELIES